MSRSDSIPVPVDHNPPAKVLKRRDSNRALKAVREEAVAGAKRIVERLRASTRPPAGEPEGTPT